MSLAKTSGTNVIEDDQFYRIHHIDDLNHRPVNEVTVNGAAVILEVCLLLPNPCTFNFYSNHGCKKIEDLSLYGHRIPEVQGMEYNW